MVDLGFRIGGGGAVGIVVRDIGKGGGEKNGSDGGVEGGTGTLEPHVGEDRRDRSKCQLVESRRREWGCGWR